MKVFRRFKTVVIVAAAAALVAIPSPALGGTAVSGRVTPNSRLTSDKAVLRGHDTPGVAVDPNNPNHIVLIEEDYLAGQCDFHTSFDGGHTWTDGVLTVPSDFANPPCRTYDSGGYAHFNQSVVFGSGQNVYTVFASHRGLQERPESHVVQGEGDSIIMNHSSDGGKTWSTGVVAIQGGPGPQPYVIRPGIAVVPNASGDKLYVTAWSVFVTSGGASGGGGDRQLITSASTDGGKTWSAPVFASATGEHVREDSPPVVGPDGAIYVAWRNRDDPSTAPHPIVVAKSTDGGQTWTETPVAQVIPTPTGASGSTGYPRIAIDPKSNTVYVTYRNFNSSNVLSVYVSHSTDQNKTWSTPVQVNDDTVNVQHIGNEISVAPNGRVDVAWLDYRSAYPTATQLKATSEGNIFYASSSDGGNTFSASRRITDRSINLDDGLNGRNGSFTWWTPVMAELGNNSVLFAWSDSRLGSVDNDNNDIELATLQLNSSAPPAVSSLPSTNLSNESVAASQLAYPAGEERIGSTAFSKLVIAPENDPASAMAGAVLARANFGPLLLSPATGLTKDLKDEISRLRPSAIYLVGSTVALSSMVETQLAGIGFKSVTRIQQPTAAAMAAAVANAMDARTTSDMSQGVASAPAAVLVNPAAPDAAAGVSLAAAMRYPLLYTAANSLPSDTTSALQSLDIPKVYVVGSTTSISDSVEGQLPGAVRITGADVEATSMAVASTEAKLNVPFNVAYVADSNRPADAALAASTAARVGALVALVPHADAGQAQTAIASLHLGALDEVIQVHSKTSSTTNVGVIVLFIVLGLVGLLLLLASVAMRRRSREPQADVAVAEPVAV
ncbi:MAG: cell wall-binding repeat-containing protein [Acidimicrobiales bacterium]